MISSRTRLGIVGFVVMMAGFNWAPRPGAWMIAFVGMAMTLVAAWPDVASSGRQLCAWASDQFTMAPEPQRVASTRQNDPQALLTEAQRDVDDRVACWKPAHDQYHGAHDALGCPWCQQRRAAS